MTCYARQLLDAMPLVEALLGAYHLAVDGDDENARWTFSWNESKSDDEEDIIEVYSTAELRERLPINGVLEADECQICKGKGYRNCWTFDKFGDPLRLHCSSCNGIGYIPLVTRKEPDPALGPGNRCWCVKDLNKDGTIPTNIMSTGDWIVTQLDKKLCSLMGCLFCSGTGIIQEPRDGHCSHDRRFIELWEVLSSQRQIRHDEYVRRNKIKACSLLCHWTRPDHGWCFNDSLMSKRTADRVRAFLYSKYGSDLRSPPHNVQRP